jgi:hypothetical protein
MPNRIDGFVYFIRASNGLIKIGYSRESPDGRFYTLQTASPLILERLALIRANHSIEQELHRRFADLHSHGEWFHSGDKLLEFIRERGTPWTESITRKEALAMPIHHHEDLIGKGIPWIDQLRAMYKAWEIQDRYMLKLRDEGYPDTEIAAIMGLHDAFVVGKRIAKLRKKDQNESTKKLASSPSEPKE